MTLRLSTRIFLVLLQLAIGWHLFYEGIWKLQNPSWTSQGYLRNASGPFALAMRWTAGDPDVSRQGIQFVEADPAPALLERFTIKPFDPAEKPEERRPHKHLPEPVREQWQAYYDAFVKHYKLDSEPREQLQQAEADLTDAIRRWEVLDVTLMRARTQRDLASVLDARGDHRAANAQRLTAMRTFQACGAREYGELALDPDQPTDGV